MTHDAFKVNNEEKTALEERLAEAGFQIKLSDWFLKAFSDWLTNQKSNSKS